MECGGKHSAPHRGRLRRPLVATALKPLLAFFARGTRLEGGNRGVQKCDSVDPLSLVIKCLGGGGHESEASIVRTSTHGLLPLETKLTHTHFGESSGDFGLKVAKTSVEFGLEGVVTSETSVELGLEGVRTSVEFGLECVETSVEFGCKVGESGRQTTLQQEDERLV